MDLSLSNAAPVSVKTGVLAVGAFADGLLTPSAQAVDAAAGGKLAAALKRGDLDEKAGSTLLLPDLPGVAAERVLLVSLGKRADLGDKAFRDAVSGAAKALAGGVARSAAVALVDLDLPNRTAAWRVQQAARLLADGAYKFDAPRQNKPPERGASAITLLVAEATPALDTALKRGQAIAEGMALATPLALLAGISLGAAALLPFAAAAALRVNLR